jgi:L-amino acid N-acyltransferase YncA
VTVSLREANEDDWPAIHPIFAAVTATGETYAYPEDLSSAEASALWMGQGRVVVAELDGVVVGTATMGPNRPGRGAHIATGSFMVAPIAAGRGVGRALGEHLVAWAREEAFRGIQFNAVVETNEPALRLWRSLGFVVVGTVPGAFRHPERGYVGLHIMFLDLTDGRG